MTHLTDSRIAAILVGAGIDADDPVVVVEARTLRKALKVARTYWRERRRLGWRFAAAVLIVGPGRPWWSVHYGGVFIHDIEMSIEYLTELWELLYATEAATGRGPRKVSVHRDIAITGTSSGWADRLIESEARIIADVLVEGFREAAIEQARHDAEYPIRPGAA